MAHGWQRWWSNKFARPLGTAWGALADAQCVNLVCLGRQAGGDARGVARVLSGMHLSPPSWLEDEASRQDWLVDTLREASAHEVRRHRGLTLALPAGRYQSGWLELPTPLDSENLQAEVQLEAAQSLGVSADDVSFDFEILPTDLASRASTDQRVRWLACRRTEIRDWRMHTRAAGWRLPAIESDEQAAARALQALRGGLSSLHAQPYHDWRFDVQAGDASADRSDDTLEEVLAEARDLPIWPWLAACGAGLRAFA